jgi:hypothetical protein
MTKKIPETPDQKKARELTETIAKTLSELVTSIKQLLGGPLKRKTLLILLSHSAGISQASVNQVLTALENLEKDWINK